MQFEKLTIKSQEALAEAQSQASSRGHSRIEPAHLLQALLGQPEGSTVPVLQKLGIGLEVLRAVASQALLIHVRHGLVRLNRTVLLVADYVWSTASRNIAEQFLSLRLWSTASRNIAEQFLSLRLAFGLFVLLLLLLLEM